MRQMRATVTAERVAWPHTLLRIVSEAGEEIGIELLPDASEALVTQLQENKPLPPAEEVHEEVAEEGTGAETAAQGDTPEASAEADASTNAGDNAADPATQETA